MNVHLLRHPTNLTAPRVDDGGGIGPLEVKRGNLVYPGNDLVNLAVIELVPLAVDTGRDVAELRLPGHVIPRQVALIELVVVG